MNQLSGDVKVAACGRGELHSVLQWLYRDLDDASRRVQVESSARGFGDDDVFVATRAGTLIGAIVSRLVPGRVGWLWPPHLDEGEFVCGNDARIAEQLVRCAIDRMARAGIRLVQTLLPTDASSEALVTNGLRRIAEMIRMVRPAGPPPIVSDNSAALEFLPFAETLRRDFEEVVLHTYEQSRDCPELDGLRSVSETLDGYLASGESPARLWYLAAEFGKYVGCLLVAEFPDEARCDLQYMGVVREARGRRLGMRIAARAIELADECGADELWLSVDSRNLPAIRHYQSLGFIEADRRVAYFRPVA